MGAGADDGRDVAQVNEVVCNTGELKRVTAQVAR